MIPSVHGHITRIGKRNQVTIPAEMLRKLKMKPGQHVRLCLVNDRVEIELAEDPIQSALGFLESDNLPRLTDSELEQAIDRAWEEGVTAPEANGHTDA